MPASDPGKFRIQAPHSENASRVRPRPQLTSPIPNPKLSDSPLLPRLSLLFVLAVGAAVSASPSASAETAVKFPKAAIATLKQDATEVDSGEDDSETDPDTAQGDGDRLPQLPTKPPADESDAEEVEPPHGIEVEPPPAVEEEEPDPPQERILPDTLPDDDALIAPLAPPEAPSPLLQSNPNPLYFPTQPSQVETDTTEPITLEQALELARRNNTDLQEALLELEQAHATLDRARAARWPDIDLSASITGTDSASSELSIRRQEALGIRPQQAAIQPDTTSTTVQGQIQISYDVFTSGQRGAQIAVAERQLEFLTLDVERIDEDIRLQVTEAYYNLQETDELVRIAASSVEQAEESLNDARALEEAGVGTRFDVLRAEVQLANEQQLLTQRLSDQRISRRQLAQILNLHQNANISAADEPDIAGLWNLPLEETIVLAYKNRSELEQFLIQREIAQQQRIINRTAVLPQVSAFANYNVLEATDDELGFADGTTLGLQFNWRLFDGFEARAAAREQEFDVQIAETQFNEQLNLIRFQVEQSYASLRASFENIQTSRRALGLAEESLRLARLRFLAGVGTQTDVLQAEDDLTEARGNVVQAILDYNRALANLQRAVSNLPLTDVVEGLEP